MKIKHKLYVSGAASILLMLLIGGVIIEFSNRVERDNQKRDVAQGVLREVSELGFLTNEYLLNREESSEEKWNSKYNAVAKILITGEKEETQAIRLDFIFVGDMFLQVTRNYDRTLALTNKNAPSEEIDATIELETMMVAQLTAKMRSIIDEASILHDNANSHARSSLEFSNKVQITLLVVLALGIVITSYFVSRSISKPLDELTKGAEIIGRGDLTYRTGIKNRDEIGLLSAAFDHMAERLSTTTVSRDTLAQEVDLRREAEAQLTTLLEELEDKNAELEQFTYTVSHDLKSPLITIKGFLGTLEEDIARGDPERIKSDMARISGGADRMRILLDELLELSRIGRVAGPPEEIELGELANDALAMVAGEIEERKIEVTVADGLPVVFGDRLRIREVLQNMVENSAKFMGDEPNPRMEIGGLEGKGETVCFVRDNGIGIDPRYHKKVFDLFDKLDRDTDGTGIGLAIIKRIVNVHGGRVWVESEGLGHGSTFFFTLPTKNATSAASRDEGVLNAR